MRIFPIVLPKTLNKKAQKYIFKIFFWAAVAAERVQGSGRAHGRKRGGEGETKGKKWQSCFFITHKVFLYCECKPTKTSNSSNSHKKDGQIMSCHPFHTWTVPKVDPKKYCDEEHHSG